MKKKNKQNFKQITKNWEKNFLEEIDQSSSALMSLPDDEFPAEDPEVAKPAVKLKPAKKEKEGYHPDLGPNPYTECGEEFTCRELATKQDALLKKLGVDMKKVQSQLKSHFPKNNKTFKKGSPDGLYGGETYRAILKAQGLLGVSPTGLVDDATLKAIEGTKAGVSSWLKGSMIGNFVTDAVLQVVGGDESMRDDKEGIDIPPSVARKVSAKAATKQDGDRLNSDFHLDEFTFGERRPLPPGEEGQRIRNNISELADELSKIKSLLGISKMTLNSGYRGPKKNKEKGGASNSVHLQGRAADFICGNEKKCFEYYLTLLDAMKSGQIRQGGLGYYSYFLHYDTRGRAARWHGDKSKVRPSDEMLKKWATVVKRKIKPMTKNKKTKKENKKHNDIKILSENWSGYISEEK